MIKGTLVVPATGGFGSRGDSECVHLFPDLA